MRYKEYKKVDIPWIDEVPSHWEISRIKNYTKVVSSPLTKDICLSNGIYPIYDANKIIGYHNIINVSQPYISIIKDGAGVGRVRLLPQNSGILATMNGIIPEGININFLFRYLENFDFSNYINSTTIPHIYYNEYSKDYIPIPPKKEQEQIARFLDWKINEIDRLINSKEKELDNLEKLIESKIERVLLFNNKVEKNMSYGDALKGIPTIRIKNIFTLRNERNLLSENEVELLSLYTKLGVLKNKDIEYKTGNKNTTVLNYKIVKENDIVVNIMLCWMGAVGISKYDGVISPAYDVYIPNLMLVNSLYYHYFFRSNLFKNELYRNGKGIVLMKWRVYSDKFMNIRVPLFTLDQQEFILKKIENIKEEFKKNLQNLRCQVNNLKQLKQSLISDVVTGKIDVRNISIPEYEKISDIEDDAILEENFNEEV